MTAMARRAGRMFILVRKASWKIAAVFMATGAAASVSAAEPKLTDTQDQMLKPVYEQVFNNVLRLVQPGDGLKILLLARQRAASSSCEGFVMSAEKLGAAMNEVTKDLAELTEPGQNNLPVDAIYFGYSMAVGGELAAAAYDTETYCAVAAALREQTKKSGTLDVLE